MADSELLHKLATDSEYSRQLFLQVTEDDYKQASANPTQQITVSPRRESQPILSAHEKTLVLQGLAIIRET